MRNAIEARRAETVKQGSVHESAVGVSRCALTLVSSNEPRGPSEGFIGLTRNPKLKPPVRFEPTRKGDGDIIIGAAIEALGSTVEGRS